MAEVVDLFEHTKNEYTANFKILNFSGYINQDKRLKLMEKMNHCKSIMNWFAMHDPHTVSFNEEEINCTDKQFLTFWHANSKNMLYTVDFTPVIE